MGRRGYDELGVGQGRGGGADMASSGQCRGEGVDDGASLAQAVAALVDGDRSSFYGCGFFSVQDTLCDMAGRHYYENCVIGGAVDFIFSNARSIFQVQIKSGLPINSQHVCFCFLEKKGFCGPGSIAYQ